MKVGWGALGKVAKLPKENEEKKHLQKGPLE